MTKKNDFATNNESKRFYARLNRTYDSSLLSKDEEKIIFDKIIQCKNNVICEIMCSKDSSDFFIKSLEERLYPDLIILNTDQKEVSDKIKEKHYLKTINDYKKIYELLKSKRGARGEDTKKIILKTVKKYLYESESIHNIINKLIETKKIKTNVQKEFLKNQKELHELKWTLIGKNMKLISSKIQSIGYASFDQMDLMQEGVFGLITAIDKFDISRGNKFSTYATPWIQHAVGRAVQNKNEIIRVPVYVQELNSKISKAERSLMIKNQDLSDENIAKEIGNKISTRQVKKAREAKSVVMSLSQSMDDDSNKTFEDQIASSDVYNVEDATISQDFTNKIDQTLNELKKISMTLSKEYHITDNEIYILKRKLEINSSEPYSAEEIGLKLKLSKERIRQIDCKLEQKCKNKVIQDHMRSFLL